MWKKQQRVPNFNAPGLIQSLVITSDPQYPWTDCDDVSNFQNCNNPVVPPCSKRPEDNSTKETRSAALISEQYNNINSYTDTVPNASVLINGDMTAFGHGGEWDKISSLVRILKRPYYFGLGNHDIQNNFNDCVNNGCFKNSLENLIYHVQERGIPKDQFDYEAVADGYHWGFPVTKHSGSFAYTVNFGSICSIQLQNFPTTNAFAESTITNTNRFRVFENIGWIENQLRTARANGRVIIVNVHRPDDWDGGPSTRFKNLLKDYKVAAVFCGHYHTRYGDATNHPFYSQYLGDDIPIFLSGGASQRTYLILEQFSDRLEIYAVSCNNWRSRRLEKTIRIPI
ncbi:metallophosphoesterase family protein [Bacillus wiedmannii]|uniref:metallophosphoesterase family protein n=1 Tax=Bacillus wiedmannii TaxID=1890302 RepID=UPI000B4474E4|nr:metallophosphoesterase [Bacillus wiedmannii]OUB80916.1 hypothetical protein BK788_25125 [Bacillus thuringiensis serovar sinensis]